MMSLMSLLLDICELRQTCTHSTWQKGGKATAKQRVHVGITAVPIQLSLSPVLPCSGVTLLRES